ncbi:MAG TPA: hypothetical protein VHG08_17110 [Longimicrobium sp.]|nr:hypothetical protein [Longimicrobium sp.]
MRLTGILLLAACTAGAFVPRANPALHGTYRLEQVNAQPLPYTVEDYAVTLHRGELSLRENGRYRMVFVAQPEGGAAEQVKMTGVWAAPGDSLVLTLDPGTPFEETAFRWELQGSLLRLVDPVEDEFSWVRVQAGESP